MLSQRAYLKLIFAMLSISWSSTALSENRALLIGVGKYQNPEYNLPGISVDLDIMKDTAKLMGFKPHQIKTVSDKEVTSNSIKKIMRNWLVKGVSSSDKVLIYYTGHGSQIPDRNGDESDSADEVLTLHDLKVVEKNGSASLKGVLIDDDFNQILNSIKTKDVLVVVDACHSGTSTKSLSFNSRSSGVETAFEKYLSYPGMPNTIEGFSTKSSSSSQGYTAISAARDHQKALATPSGSMFTVGVKRAIAEAAKKEQAISMGDLLTKVDRYIERTVKDKSKRFNPQVTGNQSKLIQLRPVGVNRQKVERLVKLPGVKKLNFSPNLTKFFQGDKLELDIDIPVSGYLNVLVVNPEDEATVLFPNKFQPDNYVRKGKMNLVKDSNRSIPKGKKHYKLPAGKPFGKATILVYLSEEPVNWYKDGDGDWDDFGNQKKGFVGVSAETLRSFTPTALEESDARYAAYKRVSICKSSGQCH